MSEETDDKPKIIVDEDWKAQAQAEKEELARKQAEKQDSEESSQEIPPASFSMLVSSLATQAMVALGRVPIEGKLIKQIELAKHHIDLLSVIEEKTKGNLTTEEESMLTNVLHELRMDYVAGGYHPPPEEPKKESRIQTP